MPRLITLILLLTAVFGCHGSRWASRDADYRRKYPEHTDEPLQVAKQAVDARHVAGKRGYYIGAVGRDAPVAAGVELGMFQYSRPYTEGRIALAALARDGEQSLSGGVLAGVRLQVPARVAPFVGVNGYLGWAGTKDASEDGRDNDDDYFIDEAGETDDDVLLAIAPELGLHIWADHKRRLTFSTRYFVSCAGREDEYWYFGLEYGGFGSQYEKQPHAPPPSQESLELKYYEPPPEETAENPYADLLPPVIHAEQYPETTVR